MFSGKRDDWETPDALFRELDREFGFDLDVCATPENAKCAKFFSHEDDGLKQEWKGVCWMNPPYGREIGRWLAKAAQSAASGATVVCLVPARTDTRWWHEFCQPGEVRFLRGRVRFVGTPRPAPFPSAVIVLRSNNSLERTPVGDPIGGRP
jgi:phage N-6-adenine-methyltransferase